MVEKGIIGLVNGSEIVWSKSPVIFSVFEKDFHRLTVGYLLANGPLANDTARGAFLIVDQCKQ